MERHIASKQRTPGQADATDRGADKATSEDAESSEKETQKLDDELARPPEDRSPLT